MECFVNCSVQFSYFNHCGDIYRDGALDKPVLSAFLLNELKDEKYNTDEVSLPNGKQITQSCPTL